MAQNTTTQAFSANEKAYDMIVIGGGISGLSMAHWCAKQGWSVLLLETTERLGGALHSHVFQTPAQDFWVEMGAHSCFNSYGNLIDILQDLHLIEQARKKNTAIFRFWRNEKSYSIPSQLSWLPLFLTPLKLFLEPKRGRTVKAYYTGLFGNTNYQRVFQHAFNAVICQTADEFPAELLFRKKPRHKSVLKSFTFPQGLQSIAEAISKAPGIEIRTQTSVQELSFSHPEFSLQLHTDTTNASTLVRSRYLTIATPVEAAKTLLQTAFPALSELLTPVQTVQVESVGVLVEKTALKLEQLAGIIAVDNGFYSMVSRDTVEHETYRGFTFHFKPQQLSEVEKRRLICQVLGIAQNDILQWQTKLNALPALRVEHQWLVHQLDEQLHSLPLAITGNYLNGVSIEDCVTRSVVEFKRLSASSFNIG